MYGPQQFTEADVAAAAAKEKEEKEVVHKIIIIEIMITTQMEQKAEDDIAEPEEEDKIKQEEAVDQTKSCSQCQVTWTILTEVHISHPDVLQGGLGDAVVSLVCWHVTCRKCWLRKLVNFQDLTSS